MSTASNTKCAVSSSMKYGKFIRANPGLEINKTRYLLPGKLDEKYFDICIRSFGVLWSLQSGELLTSKRYIELRTELNNTRDAKSMRRLAKEPILR